MIEEFLKILLDELWLALIDFNHKVKSQTNIANTNSYYKIIMFLIDYNGKTIENKTLFAEKYDSSWKSNIPIKLPNLCHFFVEDLEPWINQERDLFPVKVIQDITHTIHKQILNGNDRGVPLEILEKICNLCDCNLCELEDIYK
ncbi:MAG: hypothetical protein AB4372_01265 [Xenococcus sp. (in: cyanobacteria)]